MSTTSEYYTKQIYAGIWKTNLAHLSDPRAENLSLPHHHHHEVMTADVSYVTAGINEKAAQALCARATEPVMSTAQDGGTYLLVVLDGSSTVGVVEDESRCVDVKSANIYVKTGGQGKPNIIHYTKIGILPIRIIWS